MTEKLEGPAHRANGDGAGKRDKLAGCVASTNSVVETYEQESFKRYVLAELRAAAARLRVEICDIEAIGVALKANWISTDDALAHMFERDLLHRIGPEAAS